ncbi:MAG: peptide-methionine (S)-S-oxide reductase MsrA [Myxococcota bacterium]
MRVGERLRVPQPDQALPGRSIPLPVPDRHCVLGTPLAPPYPSGLERTVFGMGCFWGAERSFWQLPGVFTTAVGYAGGSTPNPLYEEVCSGRTGHGEVVLVVFDPRRLRYEELLRVFWEGHDPTQGMRQGNDVGTQYRSGLYPDSAEQREQAEASLEIYQRALRGAGRGPITTEIQQSPDFYFAESTHQQYLAKHAGGYCGLGGTGVPYPVSTPG